MRTRLLPVLGVVAVVGCGGPATTDLTGRVTFNGKPVGAGTIVFTSADGVRQGSAALLDDGTFRMPDAPIGEVTVHVQTKQFRTLPKRDPQGTQGAKGAESSVARGLDPDLMGNSYTPIPDRYERPDTSGLKLTVAPGSPRLEIELPG